MAAEDTGVMIALGIPAVFALDPLKVPSPDWEVTPPNEMHLTLAYIDSDYRDLTEEQLDAIKDTCRALQETVQAPRALFPASAGIFPPDPEDAPAEGRKVPLWYAPLPDDEIRNLREELMVHLAGRGVADLVSAKHPNFNPHVTLAYAPEGATAADIPEMPPPAPMFFTTLYLTVGPEWLAYDLTDPREVESTPTGTVPLTAAAEADLSRLSARYNLTVDLLRGVFVSTPAADRWDALHKTERYARDRLAEAGLVASAAPLFPDATRPRIDALLKRVAIEPDPTAKALLQARAFSLAASAYGAGSGSREAARLVSELRALTADGNSTAARSLRARRQLRDRKGRWIEMGGGVRWRIRTPGMGSKWFHGTVTGIDVPNGQVHVQGEDGKTYAIPNDKIEQPKAIIGLNLKSAGKGKSAAPTAPNSDPDEPWITDKELLTAPIVSDKDMKEVGEADVTGTLPASESAATDEELIDAANDSFNELKKRIPDSSPLAETRDRVGASLAKTIDRFDKGVDTQAEFEDNLNAIRDFANAVPDDAGTETDEHDHFAAFAEDLDNVAGAGAGQTADATGKPLPLEEKAPAAAADEEPALSEVDPSLRKAIFENSPSSGSIEDARADLKGWIDAAWELAGGLNKGKPPYGAFVMQSKTDNLISTSLGDLGLSPAIHDKFLEYHQSEHPAIVDSYNTADTVLAGIPDAEVDARFTKLQAEDAESGEAEDEEFDAESKAFYDAAGKIGLTEKQADDLLDPNMPVGSLLDAARALATDEAASDTLKEWAKDYDKGVGDSLNKSDAAKQAVKDFDAFSKARKALLGDTSTEDAQQEVKQTLQDAKDVPAEVPDGPLDDDQLREAWTHETSKLSSSDQKFFDERLENVLGNPNLSDEQRVEMLDKYLLQLGAKIGGTDGNPRYEALLDAAAGWWEGKKAGASPAGPLEGPADLPVEDPTPEDFQATYSDDPAAQAAWEAMDDLVGAVADAFTTPDGAGIEIDQETSDALESFNNVLNGWDSGNLSDPEHIHGFGAALAQASDALTAAMSQDETADFSGPVVDGVIDAVEDFGVKAAGFKQSAPEPAAEAEPEPAEPSAPNAFTGLYHEINAMFQGTPVSEPMGAAGNAVAEIGAQYLSGQLTAEKAASLLDAVVTDIDMLFDDPVYGPALSTDEEDGLGGSIETPLGDDVEDIRMEVASIRAKVLDGGFTGDVVGSPADDTEPEQIGLDLAEVAFADVGGMVDFFINDMPPKNPTTKKSLKDFYATYEKIGMLPPAEEKKAETVEEFEAALAKIVADLKTDAPNKNKKLLTYEDNQDDIDGLDQAGTAYVEAIKASQDEPTAPEAETPAPAPAEAPEETEDEAFEAIGLSTLHQLLDESAEEGNPLSKAVGDALKADPSPEAVDSAQEFLHNLIALSPDDQAQAFLVDTSETLDVVDPSDIVETEPAAEPEPAEEVEPDGIEQGEPAGAEPGAGGEAPGLGVDDGGAAGDGDGAGAGDGAGEPAAGLGVAVQGSGIDNSVLGTEYTDGEKLAIATYAGADNVHPTKGDTAYRHINAAFRKGGDPTFANDPWSKRIVQALDSAMSRSELAEDLVLYRGSNVRFDAPSKAEYDSMYNSLVPGAVVTNHSYLSTTNHPEWAEKVAKVGLSGNQTPHKYSNRLVWEITAPAGSKMLRTFSNNGLEDELLAPHGSRLQITEVTDEPGANGSFDPASGIRRVKATLLPPAEGTADAAAAETPAEAASLDSAIDDFAVQVGASGNASAATKILDAADGLKTAMANGLKSKTNKWAGIDSHILGLNAALDAASTTMGDFETPNKIKAALEAGGVAVTDKLALSEAQAEAAPTASAPATGAGNVTAEELANASVPIDFSSWKKIGDAAGGTHGGAQYESPDGQKAYIKPVTSASHANNEVLASLLYKDLGVNSADVFLGTNGGTGNFVVSYLAPGSSFDSSAHLNAHVNDQDVIKKAQAGFVASGWMANWDSVGPQYNNIVVGQGEDGEKTAYYIDGGGALLYHGTGSPKGMKFSPTTSELTSMKSSLYDPKKAKVYGSLTPQEIQAQVQALADTMTSERLAEIVNATGFTTANKNKLIKTLTERKFDMMAKTGITAATGDDEKIAEIIEAAKSAPAANAAKIPSQPAKPYSPAAGSAHVAALNGTESSAPLLWVGADGNQLKVGQAVVSVKDGLQGKVVSLSSNGKYAKVDDGSGTFKYRHPSTLKPTAAETPEGKAAEAVVSAFVETEAAEPQTAEEKAISDSGALPLTDDDLANLEIDDSEEPLAPWEKALLDPNDFDFSKVPDPESIPEQPVPPQAVPAAPAGSSPDFDPDAYEFKAVTANNAYPGMVNKKGETLLSKTASTVPGSGKPGWDAVIQSKNGDKKLITWGKYSGIGAWADGAPVQASPEPVAQAPSVVAYDSAIGETVALKPGDQAHLSYVTPDDETGEPVLVEFGGTLAHSGDEGSAYPWTLVSETGSTFFVDDTSQLVPGALPPEPEPVPAAPATPAFSAIEEQVDNAKNGDYVHPPGAEGNPAKYLVKSEAGWQYSAGGFVFEDDTIKNLLESPASPWTFNSVWDAPQPAAEPDDLSVQDASELEAAPVGSVMSMVGMLDTSKPAMGQFLKTGNDDWQLVHADGTVNEESTVWDSQSFGQYIGVEHTKLVIDEVGDGTVPAKYTKPDSGLPASGVSLPQGYAAPGPTAVKAWQFTGNVGMNADKGTIQVQDEDGITLYYNDGTTQFVTGTESSDSHLNYLEASTAWEPYYGPGDGAPTPSFALPAGYGQPTMPVINAWKYAVQGGISESSVKEAIVVQTADGFTKFFNDGTTDFLGAVGQAPVDEEYYNDTPAWKKFEGVETASDLVAPPVAQASQTVSTKADLDALPTGSEIKWPGGTATKATTLVWNTPQEPGSSFLTYHKSSDLANMFGKYGGASVVLEGDPSVPTAIATPGQVTQAEAKAAANADFSLPAYSKVPSWIQGSNPGGLGANGAKLWQGTKVMNLSTGKSGDILSFDSSGNAKVYVPSDGKVRLWKANKLSLDNTIGIPTNVYIPTDGVKSIHEATKAVALLDADELAYVVGAGIDVQDLKNNITSGNVEKMDAAVAALSGIPAGAPQSLSKKVDDVLAHLATAKAKIQEVPPAPENPDIPSGMPLAENSIQTFDPGTVWVPGDLDTESPWYGQEKPQAPTEQSVADIPHPLGDEWLQNFADAYEAKYNKDFSTSYRYKKFKAAQSGNEAALKKLVDENWITQDDYEAAQASVAGYMEAIQGTKDQYVAALAKWNEDVKAWTAANGKGSLLLKGLQHGWKKMSHSEAVSWFNAKYKPSNLTSAQFSAVNTQKGSSSFQHIFRKQLKKESINLENVKGKSQHSYSTAKSLDEAVLATKPLEEDIEFIRTLNSDSFIDPKTGEPVINNANLVNLVGTVQADFGFPEATPGSLEAGGTPGYTAGTVRVVIRAPKGTRGVWTGGGSNKGSFSHPGEHGFVFERGLQYYVHGAHQEKTSWGLGGWVVDVEIIPKLGNYGGQNYYDLFESGKPTDVIIGTPGGIVNADGSIANQQADGTIDSGVTPFTPSQTALDPSDPFGDGIQF